MYTLETTGRFISQKDIKVGDLISFSYDNEIKYGLVLNPLWEKKMHAIKIEKNEVDKLKMFIEKAGSIMNEQANPELLYNFYRSSDYLSKRSYRTYSVEKIALVRRLYIKT